MSRRAHLESICSEVGSSGVQLIDANTGWPGKVSVLLPSGRKIAVAMHVSTVSPHARKPYEYRFQNPGDRSPVLMPAGHIPILIGQYEQGGTKILVGIDGRSRVGRHARFSVLFHKNVLLRALSNGWGAYQSSAGELVYAFHPSLLPIFVDAVLEDLDKQSASSLSEEIVTAAISSGLLDDDTNQARNRVRRTAEVLVRNKAFGRSVVRVYEESCAMCGFDSGLVVGAHIYPVEAPSSPDRLWNGLALCHNHHAAFDAHKIWIDPQTTRVAFHPKLIDEAGARPAMSAFIGSTYDKLAKPTEQRAAPRPNMFTDRYEYFNGQYDWAA